jgi:hypothetical protein
MMKNIFTFLLLALLPSFSSVADVTQNTGAKNATAALEDTKAQLTICIEILFIASSGVQ